MFFATATFADGNNVIEFDFVVEKHLAADLALVVIAARDAQHDVALNVSPDTAHFMCFSKRFVHKEDRTDVTKHRTGFFEVPRIVFSGIVLWIEVSNLFRKHLGPSFVVSLSSELFL